MKLSGLNKERIHFWLFTSAILRLIFAFLRLKRLGSLAERRGFATAGRRLLAHADNNHLFTDSRRENEQLYKSFRWLSTCEESFACVGLRLWPAARWRLQTPRWRGRTHSPPVWWTGCISWTASWRVGPRIWMKNSLQGMETTEAVKLPHLFQFSMKSKLSSRQQASDRKMCFTQERTYPLWGHEGHSYWYHCLCPGSERVRKRIGFNKTPRI